MQEDKAPIEGSEYEYQDQPADGDPDWVAIARSAYDASTDFLNENYRKQFEKNLSNFQSKHPAGSKYYNDSYKTRSRLFRPKTRTAVRKNEAVLASSLFGATDVTRVTAEDSDDPRKRKDAHFWENVLNYRLTKTIPWFQIAVGAFQEAQVYGVVVSKQYWEYKEGPEKEIPIPDPQNPDNPLIGIDGEVVTETEAEIIKDTPTVRLIEIENIRFDPAADWTDPLNSSPYVIECLPMYIGDILEKMGTTDSKTGQPEWTPVSKSQIIAYATDTEQSDDTTRNAREQAGDVEPDHDVSEFDIAWVHENIVRWEGEDWIYYTLGTKFLLSDPKPIKEVYKHGIRPFQAGYSVIEAHKPIPAGVVELGQDLQAEANDTVNQRLDNVKYVLNKRKVVKRNSGVDLEALLRSVPGGITLTDDMDAVKDDEVNDVTASSYNEQNRLDTDFDDITGTFSHGSVANNRQLNETVGGMQLMSQSADTDTEYLLRTFSETWVEPVLRQVVLLEQYYEDDQHIVDVAQRYADKKEQKDPEAQEVQEVPLKEKQKVDVKISVGFGNLNPDKRIQKIVQGMQALAGLAPWTAQKVEAEEVSKEIFGALGFKNADRFFTDFEKAEQQNPEVELKMQELKLKQQEQKTNAEVEEAKMAQKAQYDQAKLNQDFELGMAKIAAQKELTVEQLYAKLGMDKEKMAHERELAGAKNMTTLAGVEAKEKELLFKDRTGRQGI